MGSVGLGMRLEMDSQPLFSDRASDRNCDRGVRGVVGHHLPANGLGAATAGVGRPGNLPGGILGQGHARIVVCGGFAARPDGGVLGICRNRPLDVYRRATRFSEEVTGIRRNVKRRSTHGVVAEAYVLKLRWQCLSGNIRPTREF